MWLSFSKSDSTPLYEQAKRRIIERIMSGRLRANDELPSIRKLALESRTSVITIKRAYEELEQEGWIYTRQGKGCYVQEMDLSARKKERLEQLARQLEEWVEQALEVDVASADLMQLLQEQHDKLRRRNE